jgi:phage gpG-like protein
VEKLLSKGAAEKMSIVLFRAFQRIGEETANIVKSNLSGRILNTRTGHLRVKTESKVVSTSDNITATIGSGVRTGGRLPYAEIHETGGVIRPKRGKHLTIPMAAALTAAGVPRFTARQVFSGQTPYDKGAVIGKTVFGIMKGEKPTPLFSLVKSVTIPARRYMSRSLEEIENRVTSIIKESIAKQLELA